MRLRDAAYNYHQRIRMYVEHLTGLLNTNQPLLLCDLLAKKMKMFIRGLSTTEYHQHSELRDIVITYPDGNTHTEEWKKKHDYERD